MERIMLINTGGTIDKTYGKGKGVRDLHVGPPVSFPLLGRMELDSVITFDVKFLFKKDSLDITEDDRKEIVRTCVNTHTSKIIIVHGTDTMRDTAAALSKVSLRARTIVLTGSAVPASMRDSDAELNIGLALGACLFAPPGIYIAMNGVHRWDACAKNPDTGVFEPV